MAPAISSARGGTLTIGSLSAIRVREQRRVHGRATDLPSVRCQIIEFSVVLRSGIDYVRSSPLPGRLRAVAVRISLETTLVPLPSAVHHSYPLYRLIITLNSISRCQQLILTSVTASHGEMLAETHPILAMPVDRLRGR